MIRRILPILLAGGSVAQASTYFFSERDWDVSIPCDEFKQEMFERFSGVVDQTKVFFSMNRYVRAENETCSATVQFRITPKSSSDQAYVDEFVAARNGVEVLGRVIHFRKVQTFVVVHRWNYLEELSPAGRLHERESERSFAEYADYQNNLAEIFDLLAKPSISDWLRYNAELFGEDYVALLAADVLPKTVQIDALHMLTLIDTDQKETLWQHSKGKGRSCAQLPCRP